MICEIITSQGLKPSTPRPILHAKKATVHEHESII